jgi:hypothetical protein
LIKAYSIGAPYAAATPTSTTTPAVSKEAAVLPAMISIPGNASLRAPRPWPTPPSMTTGSCKGVVTPSTRRPCGSSARCGGCTRKTNVLETVKAAMVLMLATHASNNVVLEEALVRTPDGSSLGTIVPPATGERNGRRARSSIATTPRPAPPVAAAPANEFFSFTCNGTNSSLTLNYLEKVGTFDPDDPIEIRDNAAASTAFGRNGFNVPSLLSINSHAPYLHRGQAQTLGDVFPLHGLGPQEATFPPTTTIASTLTATQQSDLLAFLKTIDGTTPHFRSEGDDFRDALRLQGTCPAPE